MRAAAIAISASAFLLVATADKALCDDLRGYSIDATYSTGTYPAAANDVGSAPLGLPPVLHRDRIYISISGKVFAYLDTGAKQPTRVSELDQAILISLDRTATWTVEPARLLRVVKQHEGFLLETIEIDTSKSSCNVSWQVHPDPKTSRVVLQFFTGAMRGIRGYNINNATPVTCTVRKGNIFASDQ